MDSNSFLHEVQFERLGNMTRIRLQGDELVDGRYAVDVHADSMKVAAFKMRNGKVNGILTETIRLPGVYDAELISEQMVDGWLVVLVQDRALTEDALDRIERSDEVNKNQQNQRS